MLDVCNDAMMKMLSRMGELEEQGEISSMELSECVFYGTSKKTTVQTMKIAGMINNYAIKILLNSSSTHNFVDSRLLKKIGWQCHTTKPFDVMIADRGRVRS